MIRDWEDGSNILFSFAPVSPQEVVFKNSKLGKHITNMPKFSTTPASDLTNSTYFSPLVLTPMSLSLEIMFNQTPDGEEMEAIF